MVIGYNISTLDKVAIIENNNLDSYHVSEINNYERHKSSNEYPIFKDIEFEEANNVQERIQSLDGLMNSAWPMFCHNVRHTGQSPYSTAHIDGFEKWRVETIRDGVVEGGPVIDRDGIIYYGTMLSDGNVYALYPNGTIKWKYDIDCWVITAPAIDENGVVYVGTQYHWNGIYAINPNGTLKWRYDTGSIYSNPAIGTDGTIYFGTPDNWDPSGSIYALYPNGTLRWRFRTLDNSVLSSPAIGEDGTVYCGSHDTYLYALYPNNGTLKWKYKTGHFVRVSPCIGDDGTIYIVSLDSYLHAVNPDGTLKWKTDVGAGTSPTIAQDGIIYCGYSNLKAVYSNNGSVKWSLGVDGKIRGSTPCHSADGTTYFGTNEGWFYAVNSNGTVKWRKKIADEWIESAPAIGEDGTVYVGSSSWIGGYLHAFGPQETNEPPEAPTIRSTYYDFTFGVTGTEYWYTFVAHDPDNNPIRLFVDWGDGNSGWVEWVDWFASGENMYAEHTWKKKGNYTIKAKVKDVFGEESDWGYFTFEAVNGKSCILMGEIKDFEPLYKYGQWSAKAKSLWVIQFFPFSIKKYTSGEKFYFYRGVSIMELDWLFGFFLIWWDQ